ncbi:MAG: HlyC/CorC family transporter [Candidatus Omnitrophica bacterium]|nr:HlyC/CorC family transporter [Candidatus Omnitrophota bacterium]
MWTISFLLIGVLVAAGFCAMAEAAILSLPSIRARLLKEHNKPNADDLLYIKDNIAYAIATVVILNNAVTIIGSIFIGEKISAHFGNQWLGLASAVITFAIIIIGEIIPKMIGERYKTTISLMVAKPVRALVWLFHPIVSLTMSISNVFTGPYKRMSPRITEDEIKMMLKLGRVEGTVEMDEEVLCSRVFRLNDIRAVQIMKPIDGIFALEANKTLGEIKEAIISCRYSRVAVYDKDPKDFVGVVQQRVLLREIAKDNYSSKVRDFMQDPIFVSWFTKADTLLEKFQAHNQHLFIVQDARGKDVGLITMEDVLEELFGEIYDEKDIARANPLKKNEGSSS